MSIEKIDDFSKFYDDTSPEVWFLQTDGSYVAKDAGIGFKIFHRKREYAPGKDPIKAKGPLHTELCGMRNGLREILRKVGDDKVVYVCCDSEDALKLASGAWNPQKDYIEKVVTEITILIKEFYEVRFYQINGKDAKQVDKLSKAARKERQADSLILLQKREQKFNEAMEKGKGVKVRECDGLFFAKSSSDPEFEYKISIDPPLCTCAHWEKRWAGTPEIGRYKNRLPCKHICGLAIHLKKEEALKKLFLK
jgi:hypothetical protein